MLRKVERTRPAIVVYIARDFDFGSDFSSEQNRSFPGHARALIGLIAHVGSISLFFAFFFNLNECIFMRV